MDFAPRGKRPVAPTSRPASASRPTPTSRPVAAARPMRPATPRPAAPTPRPTTPRPAAPRPARPAPRPATRPRPETHFVHEHMETTIMYPSPKPDNHFMDDDFLDIEDSGLGIIEDLDGASSSAPSTPATPDAPDNSNFIFGGRSPFINTDKVKKRPLSSHLPKEKPVAKNIYDKSTKSQKSAKTLKKSTTPTVVKGSASRGSNISLAIAIILTVIFGALVGTFVYLAFFQ